MYDIIIIGGGPSGLTAAIYARRAGKSVLVLESAVCGGQIINSQSVDNFPTRPGTPGWQLADEWQRHVQNLGAEVRFAGVTGITDGEIKTVHTLKGDFMSRSVIIANGVGHRRIDCPGATEFTGRGVSTCAACDGAFFAGRQVAVVGGGNTAFEDALYLSTICSKVWLINRRREFRAEKELQDKVFCTDNIKILTPCIPHRVLGDTRVTGFEVKNTETGEVIALDTPAVFTAIGMVPENTKFANVVKLDESGYIITDERMETGTPGIFAAGDTRLKYVRQLVSAASDGAAAATSAVSYLNRS